MGISTTATSKKDVSNYQVSTTSVGNSKIETNSEEKKLTQKENIKNNNSSEVETIELNPEYGLDNYLIDNNIVSQEELYQYIFDKFPNGDYDISVLLEEEQAMIYVLLECGVDEKRFSDVTSVSKNEEGNFAINFNDGSTLYYRPRYSMSYTDSIVDGYIRYGYANTYFTKQEIDEISRKIGVNVGHVTGAVDNGETITITLADGTSFEVSKKGYLILDVLDENGNSLVEDIGMFTDEADKYGLYGGDQGYLLNDFYYYKDDPYIQEILNNYFPNETLSEDSLIALFARMDHVGCPYIAMSNVIFQMTEKLSDEEFKEKFGFDRYCVKRMPDGTYVKTYNYNYMFLDFFLSYQKNYNDFKSLSDIIGDVTIDENGNLEVSDENGANGSYTFLIKDYFKSYAEDKSIEYKSSSTAFGSAFMYWTDFDESIFNFFDAFLEYYNPFNNVYIKDKIKRELEKGNSIIVDMKNFTMYSPEDLDGNGKLDDVVKEDVGGHIMQIVGVTDDGGYIVSSWGKKYIVYPDAQNFYQEHSDTETLETMTIFEY